MAIEVMNMGSTCPVCGELLKRRYRTDEDKVPVGNGFCVNDCDLEWSGMGGPIDRQKLMR